MCHKYSYNMSLCLYLFRSALTNRIDMMIKMFYNYTDQYNSYYVAMEHLKCAWYDNVTGF